MVACRAYRGLALAGLLAGCVSVDEIQTPNGDFGGGAAGAGGAGEAGEAGETDAEGACEGWSFLRVAGREQAAEWAAPSLASSCSGTSHRLSALAPRLGAALDITLAASTGRVIDATYSTIALGADGEDWGEYAALVELDSLSFAPTATATQLPFDLAGTIWGPFGPVALAASGCALVRALPCQAR